MTGPVDRVEPGRLGRLWNRRAPGAYVGASGVAGDQTTPAPPELRVVRGHPTRRGITAIALALAQLEREAQAPRAAPPAWVRAARIEGCGGCARASAADLREAALHSLRRGSADTFPSG